MLFMTQRGGLKVSRADLYVEFMDPLAAILEKYAYFRSLIIT